MSEANDASFQQNSSCQPAAEAVPLHQGWVINSTQTDVGQEMFLIKWKGSCQVA